MLFGAHGRVEVRNAKEAKDLLSEGNRDFRKGNWAKLVIGIKLLFSLLALLLKGQRPFAIVVGCSDSRVIPEYLFAQGFERLFVVRTAGNILGEIGMGSVEYAAEHLGCRLVVVLGHDDCGAIKATISGSHAPGSIGAITRKIMPSFLRAKKTGATGKKLIELTADYNIEAVVDQIRQSPVVSELMAHGKIEVVGAKFYIDTGEVKFFEEKELAA